MITTVYDFFVYGKPKAQPRPRMSRNGHVYNPDSADVWKAAVENHVQIYRKPMIVEPVHLSVTFYLPWAGCRKSDPERVPHGKKPDADNLLKAVMDAMTVAGVWKDDALVFATETSKWLSKEKHGARIIVKTGY
jgi:Holliday junction resolvase RusA-like endonuclease